MESIPKSCIAKIPDVGTRAAKVCDATTTNGYKVFRRYPAYICFTNSDKDCVFNRILGFMVDEYQWYFLLMAEVLEESCTFLNGDDEKSVYLMGEQKLDILLLRCGAVFRQADDKLVAGGPYCLVHCFCQL